MALCPTCRVQFQRSPEPPPATPLIPSIERQVHQIRNADPIDLSDWGILRTYASMHARVSLDRAALEAAEIPSYIPDEGTLSLNLISGALQGVRLYVPLKDLERAGSLLQHAVLEPDEAPAEAKNERANPGPECPHCGSTETFLQRNPGRFTVLKLCLFGIPYLLSPKELYCFPCRKHHPTGTPGATDRTLLTAGLASLAAGAGVYVWTCVRVDEKADKHYAFGHWFDLVWEVAAPLAALGLILLLARFASGPGARAGSGRR